MKLVIETTQHSMDTIISIIQETREVGLLKRAIELDDVAIAIAIAENNQASTADILRQLYDKFLEKDKVIKAICNNPQADSDLLHEIVVNRNKYAIWVYQDTLSHPNLSKEDLYTLFDDIVKYDMRIAYKFARKEDADKGLLIKIMHLAYEKKDFDLLVTLMKNPKISKEDLI